MSGFQDVPWCASAAQGDDDRLSLPAARRDVKYGVEAQPTSAADWQTSTIHELMDGAVDSAVALDREGDFAWSVRVVRWVGGVRMKAAVWLNIHSRRDAIAHAPTTREVAARLHLKQRRIIQLSELDVFHRTRWALQREGLELCRASENSDPLRDLGRHYIADAYGNAQTTHVDLLALAQGIGVLRGDEGCPVLSARRKAEREDTKRKAQILMLCRPKILLR